jgi:hypothetical protein
MKVHKRVRGGIGGHFVSRIGTKASVAVRGRSPVLQSLAAIQYTRET